MRTHQQVRHRLYSSLYVCKERMLHELYGQVGWNLRVRLYQMMSNGIFGLEERAFRSTRRMRT